MRGEGAVRFTPILTLATRIGLAISALALLVLGLAVRTGFASVLRG